MSIRSAGAAVAAVMFAAACAGPGPPPQATARLLFAGDIMLGRGVAEAAAGGEVLTGIRRVVSDADVAAANLESPLTRRDHVSANPNALEADPATARLLAEAGFDLASLANNHAGDAGPDGVMDTVGALEDAGVAAVGAGRDRVAAAAPVTRTVHGLRVAFLAFDLSGAGLGAGEDTPGIASYDGEATRRAVADAAADADVVAVSLHGGIQYLRSDAVLSDAAADLVAAGADVVWGHGAHVVHPVEARPGPDGAAVVATGLGNLLFDQTVEGTRRGAVLEVVVSADGVLAYRTGATDHTGLRVRFDGWDTPGGAAVLLDGEWWSPTAVPDTAAPAPPRLGGFPGGEVTAAATGDLTGDGGPDLVVSFRRPYEASPVGTLFPGLVDAAGRSAHLGVYEPDTLREVWVAGTLLRPVGALAVCDGSLAVAYDGLDDPTVVATGALTWAGFGFVTAPDLPGPGVPGCRDVDGDGTADPVVTGRIVP